jgi:hypothetical protein
MARILWFAAGVLAAVSARASAAPCTPTGSDLIVDGITCQLSGVQTYDSVQVINGGVIDVNIYDGTDKIGTGNLELRANTITVDATSKISARGRGYQTPLCGNGVGPLTATGVGDSFTKVGNTITLTDGAGVFKPEHVGRLISIVGLTNATGGKGNGGVFVITAVPSATEVQFTNSAGSTGTFGGNWVWTIDDPGAGRGGCSLLDSGGGGGHFGIGGRGTIDNPGDPPVFEQDCSQPAPAGDGVATFYFSSGGATVAGCTLPGTGTTDFGGQSANCGTRDGVPTVAGGTYYHSIYEPEFGASGGDKGCRDGDGRDPNDTNPSTDVGIMVAGGGGGRIVLAALDGGAGTITIDGTLDANGRRGCGIGNDSGGGGAGGTIFVVGEQVNIGATAVITAAGGLGGDTQGLSTDPTGECGAPYQQNQTADDCGGGGGGGIVSVLSVTASINDRAVFSVNGGLGGVSDDCRGEAGGGVGEIQISNSYVGEFCDGFDNDFDDNVDEGLGTLDCASSTLMACINGIPQQCEPDVPACQAPVTDTRARFAVVVDTSGSMLLTPDGDYTFGDGSVDHPGRDLDGNAKFDDSRLFKAKSALGDVIAAYPEIDFALARYHQDELANRSCQLAHTFECNDICCTYDNPSNNSGPQPSPTCTVDPGAIDVKKDSPGDECINYAGSCGPPRRGADVLVGFGADINNYLMWLDGTETSFNTDETSGAYCDFANGGDCELRGTGPTPLANSLQAVEDYLTPIKACDLAAEGTCRKYNTILLTDGAESCQGDPVAAATALRNKGINTYVIGFSTLPTETAQLDAIASAGGTGTAFLANDSDDLANTLASIVSSSVVFETCNDLDDDCDTFVDEDFPGKGASCTNGKNGACFRPGTRQCTGNGLACDALPIDCVAGRLRDPSNNDLGPCDEICNTADDDCDGKIDEGLSGCTCVSQGAEQCDNDDDDCDGTVDEDTDIPCGNGVCAGVRPCQATPGCDASPTCSGANCCLGACTATPPAPEICNGADDDCDGLADGFTEACSNMSTGFPPFDALNNPGADHATDTPCETLNATDPGKCICQPGRRTCQLNGGGTYSSCDAEVTPQTEVCNGLDDDCDGLIDETPAIACTTNAECAGSPLTPSCVDNTCQPADCSLSGCGGKLLCVAGVPTCQQAGAVTDPTCNNIDDDCDGNVDEEWQCADPDGPDDIAGNADDCPCSASGQCNAHETCVNGGVVCQGSPVSQESCNCLDDNCNGVADEGSLCPSGADCVSCQCAFHCAAGEFPCPLGQKCKGPAPDDYCIADACYGVTCPTNGAGDKMVCIDDPNTPNAHQCVTACSQVSCTAGFVCVGSIGECRPDDCTTFPERCSANQSCVVNSSTGAGECVTNPCADVTCSEEQYCVGGNCIASCADVECAAGQRCRLGACETDPCGAPCPFGEACNDSSGECIEDPCKFRECPQGQWCNPNTGGQCEADPCVGTTCPHPGEVCRGGTCFDPDDFRPDAAEATHVTVGGGGCSTTGGSGLLLALALLFVRRRRAGGAR